MALQAATSFLPWALSARKEGAVKDSAFLGVHLADGLKLETGSLGMRTKREYKKTNRRPAARKMRRGASSK